MRAGPVRWDDYIEARSRLFFLSVENRAEFHCLQDHA
jgi:hypothetical protein